MPGIVVVSLLSPLYAPVYRRIAASLAEALGEPMEYREDADWRERQAMLLEGRAQLGFLCGLPYTRETTRLALLAAPVMRAERYGDRPVYYSDVVVRADRPFRALADLEGARFAYNEPGSHTGYNLVRHRLAQLGLTGGFFGSTVETGAHSESLARILSGEADASAIDSTVLDARPDLQGRLRAVEVLGPSPIQPIVASRQIPEAMRQRLTEALLAMNLEGTPIRRLVAVRDEDYEPIRRMDRESSHIEL